MIALARAGAVALVPATAEAKAQEQGLRGNFTLVGGDGDYVTGKFGKVHLVDGKRNDKLSVHVRRLAKRTTYTFKLQTGSVRRRRGHRLDVPQAQDEPQGRRQLVGALEDLQGRQGHEVLRRRLRARTTSSSCCARLSSKGKPQAASQGARQAARQERRRARPGASDKPRGKSDDAPGQAEDKSRGKSDDAPGQAEDKPRGKSDDAPRPQQGQGQEEASPLGGRPDCARARGPRPGSPPGSVGVQPALQRGVPDERDLAVGVDPVAHAQLAHQAERVARAGAVAVGGQRAGAGLDRPAAGVQRRERAALIVGRRVQRVRAGAAQRIVVPRRCGLGRDATRDAIAAAGTGRSALNASACARSQSPALSMKRLARSASTPYSRAMSSRSPCWTRSMPRVTSSAIARSASSKDFGLSSSLMRKMIAPEPACEIKAPRLACWPHAAAR